MSSVARVISIFSTKGGVGKTVLAANLAASLLLHGRRRVGLIELASWQREATAMLRATGVTCVSDPVSPETLPGVISNLKRTSDLVLIDAGSVMHPLAVTAFEQSHLILLVITPDLPAIRQTTQALEWLQSAQFPLRMLKAVLNRAESHGNFRSSEVRARLPVDFIIAEIPSDGRTVSLSMNQGLPFVTAAPRARISAAMEQLAQALVDNPGLFVEHVTIDRAKLPASATAAWTDGKPAGAGAGPPDRVVDPMIALKRRLHIRLVEALDLKRVELDVANNPRKAQELRQRIERAVVDLLAKEQGFVTDAAQRRALVKDLVDDAIGLGPLEDLIADPEISDILVNGPAQIYVEKRGKLFLAEQRFISDQHILTVIERIIAPLGRRIDESNPMVDARLPDGSRLNAIIQPLSIRGPMLSIRKFARERFTIDELIRRGTFNRSMAEFLQICVQARKNLIVSGGTGSGKTTLLNVLSSFLSGDERIVTIEDAAELRLAQEHWVPLEARMANIEGRGEVTIRQLFRNTLRMRPDRIIVGECRGDETLDMLQAMNTGHDGSLTTLHANSPQDVISRLDSLVLISGVELPVRAIHELIASAIHLIVHTARLPDGSRKVTHIAEITGMNEQSDLVLSSLFVFAQAGVGPQGDVMGAFRSTGRRPSFFDELKSKGFQVSETLFQNADDG